MGKRFYKPPRMVDYRIKSESFFFGGFFVFMEAILALFEGKNIALEIFGYFGTAVVLLSFVMTDIKWMRIINMVGGFLSLVYAFIVGNMPVVVLNASLITINGIQLIRASRKERNAAVNNPPADAYNEEKKEENI